MKVSLSPRVAVCIPALNEELTIGPIVASVQRLRRDRIVHDLLVVDDGSTDRTGEVSARAGARIVMNSRGQGKGQALTTAVAETDAEILIFLDADVRNFSADAIRKLLAPLIKSTSVDLVKATYRRPLGGVPDEGGRVTELLALPLLRHFAPDLAAILSQPLSGECAVRRRALDSTTFDEGYGIEIGLVLDVYRRGGAAAIVEVDLGERVHRNRPLHELRGHAEDVLAAVLSRVSVGDLQRRVA